MSSAKFNLGERAAGILPGTVSLLMTGADEITIICAEDRMSAYMVQKVTDIEIDSDHLNTGITIPAAWLREHDLLSSDVVLDLSTDQARLNGLLVPSSDASSSRLTADFHRSLLSELKRRSSGRKIYLYADALDHIVRLVKRRSDWHVSLIVGKPKREFMLSYGRLSKMADFPAVRGVERLIPIPARMGGSPKKDWITLRADLLTQTFRELFHILDPLDVVCLHLPDRSTNGELLLTCDAVPHLVAGIGEITGDTTQGILPHLVSQLDRY